MRKRRDKAKNVIFIVISIGFLLSSVALPFLLLSQSRSADKQVKDQQAEIQKLIKEQQLKQKQEPSMQNAPLEGYSASVFTADDVTELGVQLLKEGDGPAATAESTVKANYFGWTADGAIFDSTNKGGAITPIDFPLSGVIAGWTKGLTGIKQGSVVELTIPGDQAYGNADDGSGRPFGPLKFIVELVEVK